jgi:predicted NodU family carbamoyl transferase
VKILGVSDMINAGAALVVDGEIVGAVAEERLNRMKLTLAGQSLNRQDFRPIGLNGQNRAAFN